MYHIQFISGTMAQTGHLAERIRILRKPAQRREDLTYGWIVTESKAMTETEVRDLLQQHGVNYPTNIPIVHGDYSVSDPSWNSTYYQWNSNPDDWLPVWLQPRWWLLAHSNEFPCDPSALDIPLAEWRKGGIEAAAKATPALITVRDIAQEFGISTRRARALAKDRHERFGIGQQLPSGQWVFQAYDLDILRPDKRYQALMK